MDGKTEAQKDALRYARALKKDELVTAFALLFSGDRAFIQEQIDEYARMYPSMGVIYDEVQIVREGAGREKIPQYCGVRRGNRTSEGKQ